MLNLDGRSEEEITPLLLSQTSELKKQTQKEISIRDTIRICINTDRNDKYGSTGNSTNLTRCGTLDTQEATWDDTSNSSDTVDRCGTAESDTDKSDSDTTVSIDTASNDTIADCRTETASSDESEVSNGEFSIWGLSGRQKFILLNVLLSDFLTSICLSLLAPFFPQEANDKHISDAVSGWIFGVFPLTQFVFAPFCGKLIPILGGKFMYLAGAFWGGGCTVLFGFLQYVPVEEDGGTAFVALCFSLRIFLAAGCTSLQTAGYVYSFNEFPKSIVTVFGIMEVFVGLGFMTGPAIGGLLYGLGGFYLPFVVVGGLILASVPINYCFLPRLESPVEMTGEDSVWKLLKMPSICAMTIVVVAGSVIFSILDPTLEPHLRKFDLSAEIVGLLFLLMSAFYALTAPLWGRIADKMNDNKILLIPGFIFSAIGLLLLGPSPILCLGADYNELWLNVLALCLLGMSSSLAIIPSFDVFLDLAGDVGFEDNVGTYAIVAGLWCSMYALGDFIGPSVGGMLMTEVGFPMCMTYAASLCAFVVLVLIVMLVIERYHKRMRKHYIDIENNDVSDSENSKLRSTVRSEYGDSERTPSFLNIVEYCRTNHLISMDPKV